MCHFSNCQTAYSADLSPSSYFYSELAFAREQQRSGESSTEELKEEFTQRISATEKKLAMVLKVRTHKHTHRSTGPSTPYLPPHVHVHVHCGVKEGVGSFAYHTTYCVGGWCILCGWVGMV